MNTKIIIGAVLIAVGILGAVLSATADLTGLNLTQGDKDYVEFGWVQITAFAAGVLILIAGIVFAILAMLKKKAPEPTSQQTPSEPQHEATVEAQATAQQPAQVAQPSAEAAAQQPSQTPQYQQMDSQYAPSAQDQQTQAQAEQQSSESLSDLDGLDGLDSLSDDLGIDLGAQGEYECPDCGAKLAANATSCSSCGANFSEEVFECPVCATEVSKDAKECPKCGEQLADSYVDAKKE